MFICAITSCILVFFVASDQSALRFLLRVMLSTFCQVVVLMVVVAGLVVDIDDSGWFFQ